MTVKELIERLQNQDPEMVVFYNDNEYGFEEVTEVFVANSYGKDFYNDPPRYQKGDLIMVVG